jgi:hypothetical protein
MKYAVEMGSGAMIYILSFIKIGSGIEKLIRRGYTHKQSARFSHKRTFVLQNKATRLNKGCVWFR